MSLRILVTAGPTREPIDPVRFLSNRSSGKMGYAIAAAAVARGHDVELVSGPVSLAVPDGLELHQVETADEMFETVRSRIGDCGAAVFCAAVADYRPVRIAHEKVKKASGNWSLELERTRDILGSARSEFSFRGILVGFAAETTDLVANARTKLERKGCDLLIANDVSRGDIGFSSDENEAIALFPDGSFELLERQSKEAMADWIVSKLESLHEDSTENQNQRP